MARWMHKAVVVRSVYHKGGCHNNLPMYTGYDVPPPDDSPRDTDPPSMGSVCAYLERNHPKELPTYAYLPCPLGWGEVRRKAGPHGGFLGRRYDADWQKKRAAERKKKSGKGDTAKLAKEMQCPDFPYTETGFVPKFAR
jgi:hypothetical protein